MQRYLYFNQKKIEEKKKNEETILKPKTMEEIHLKKQNSDLNIELEPDLTFLTRGRTETLSPMKMKKYSKSPKKLNLKFSEKVMFEAISPSKNGKKSKKIEFKRDSDDLNKSPSSPMKKVKRFTLMTEKESEFTFIAYPEKKELKKNFNLYGNFREDEISNASPPKIASKTKTIEEITLPLRNFLKENKKESSFQEFKDKHFGCVSQQRDCVCNIF